MSQFNQPGQGGSGDSFAPKEHPEWLGKLLLVEPTEYVQGIPTNHGEVDAVKATITFLDHAPEGSPLVLSDTMIFPKVMVGQTKGSVGGMVLGRLSQGANTKGNPPWMLSDHTDADVQTATNYLNSRKAPVNQPAVTAAPSAPAAAATGGWNLPPATPSAGAYSAPAPTPAPSAPDFSHLSAGLGDFLVSKGIPAEKVAGMDDGTARMIAATFGG